jgi:hypothetical protein
MSRRNGNPKRHVVRLLPEGRWVCKGCAFSSRDYNEAQAHYVVPEAPRDMGWWSRQRYDTTRAEDEDTLYDIESVIVRRASAQQDG